MNHGASDMMRYGEFRLLLADDHVLMRQILRAIFETYPKPSIDRGSPCHMFETQSQGRSACQKDRTYCRRC